MKKLFADPKMEIKEFAVENIVTTSAKVDETVNDTNAAIKVNAQDLNWTVVF